MHCIPQPLYRAPFRWRGAVTLAPPLAVNNAVLAPPCPAVTVPPKSYDCCALLGSIFVPLLPPPLGSLQGKEASHDEHSNTLRSSTPPVHRLRKLVSPRYQSRSPFHGRRKVPCRPGRRLLATGHYRYR